MSTTTTRVSIKHNSSVILVIFEPGLDEKGLLQKSLKLFALNKEDYNMFELSITNPKGRIISSNYLRENDMLFYKKSVSQRKLNTHQVQRTKKV